MTRNLKALMLATVALSAYGALSSAAAQAAEFHCSVQPCRVTISADGAGATGHHVINITNSVSETLSVTCKKISGEGVLGTKTAAALVLTKLSYQECTANGGVAVTVNTNGCQYKLTAGEMAIEGCTLGKEIEFKLATGCTVTMPEQAGLKTIEYHNIGDESKNTTVITMKMKFGYNGFYDGNSETCLINVTKTPLLSEYATGNSLLTGETDGGGVMSNLWWA